MNQFSLDVSTTTRGRQTVFIIHDDKESRIVLDEDLVAAGFRTRAFASAGEFFAGFCHVPSACMVAVLPLPDMSVTEVLSGLAARSSCMPVIVLCGRLTVREAVDIIKAGAFDIVERSMQSNEVVTAAREATRRHAQFDSITLALATLTDRQHEVMKLLLDAHSTKEIGRILNISPKTAEKHRTNILENMQVENVVHLLVKMLPAVDVEILCATAPDDQRFQTR